MEQKIKKVSFKELTLIGMLTMSIGLSGCSKVNFSQVATQSASSISKTVNVSETVAYGNKKVDFLIVFDDSNSMLPDLQKLAASLGNFVTSLETSDIDWQMCMTTTSPVTISGVPTWGTTYKWVGYTPSTGTPATLLKRGTSNLDNIFINTVNSLTIGAPGSGDERAIKATYENFKNGVPGAVGSNGCYRQGAAVSVIIVSNEDERSVGGDSSKVKATDAAGSFQPLEAEDLPVKLVTKSQESFGADVRFTF
ncbi:MAG TPA: hypothetical protein VN132_13470, partial [Bdellovibrio sp.]|nr:hypothetical protein [Bdellovibrio sp.]